MKYEVWIYAIRGVDPSWRLMAEFDTRQEAANFVEYDKQIDARFPQGHYRYRVEERGGRDGNSNSPSTER